MAKKIMISKSVMAEAVKGSRGFVARVCRKVASITGRSYDEKTIKRILDEDSELRALFDQDRGEWVQDAVALAEDKMKSALRKGEAWAVKYALGTLGRKYGYDESSTVRIENSDPLNINFSGELFGADELKECQNAEYYNPGENAEG